MSKNRPVSTRPTFPHHDSDGKEIGNLILLRLPGRESAQLLPSLEFVRLNLHHIMHEQGEAIKSAYFMNDGMASVLTVQPDGRSVEVGLIGKEGLAGVPVIFGFKTSPLRIITQADGTAYRVDVPTLLKLLPTCPHLEKQLQRFSMILAMQSTQLAACNRLHNIDARLARWLMMSNDRIGSEVMPLTQEFLAQMLGVRRASVSVAAGTLQEAGMIAYTRGNVTILDKSRLANAACDCYAMIQNQETGWRKEAQ